MIFSKFKRLLNIAKISAVTAVSVVFLGALVPAHVLASTYGSGNYGACTYGQGCSVSTKATPSGNTSPSSGPNVPASSIILNDFSEYFSDSGKQLTLSAQQVIYFKVTLTDAATGATTVQTHTITIDAVGSNYVDITINSTPIKDRLYIGDTKQYDVTGDGHNDIQITLNNIVNGQAVMTFKQLSYTAPPAKSLVTPTTKQSSNLWLIIISLMLIGIGLLWFIIFWKRRRDRDDGSQWQAPKQ